jgi:hypothetical protein
MSASIGDPLEIVNPYAVLAAFFGDIALKDSGRLQMCAGSCNGANREGERG